LQVLQWTRVIFVPTIASIVWASMSLQRVHQLSTSLPTTGFVMGTLV
jgi:hypothetical protein